MPAKIAKNTSAIPKGEWKWMKGQRRNFN